MTRLRPVLEIARTQLLWRRRFAHLGRGVLLGRCRRVEHPRSVSIGDHTLLCNDWWLADLAPQRTTVQPKIRIGAWCRFLDEFQVVAAESVVIGDHVLTASRVFITDSDHIVDPDGPPTTSRRDFNTAPVVIEDNCWLGQNVCVLKGVRIGHHSIVAAGAVVTSDVPACSIVAGLPAKVIGSTRRE